MHILTRALVALRPGVDFTNANDTLAGIRWDTPGVTPPTKEEVDAAMATLAYQARRSAEYPPLSDLADAMVKQSADGGEALATYIETCLAVKAKYPKPELK